MSILDGFKICRKGLHQYPSNKRRCPECRKATQYRWNKKNPNCNKETSKKWYEKNKNKAHQAVKTWGENNRARKRFYVAQYRANKKQATPPWSDEREIALIYEKALHLTLETGIPHHVDHIYPLNSKYMCGLHVENNLQILTAKENIAKGNRTWPGQLDCQKD